MRVRKSATERKEEIIDATLRLAYEVGPDRLTTEAIAGSVGLTQAAIFKHFPRKQDIWEAVIGWLRETMIRRWSDAQAGRGTATARLKAILGAQLRFIATIPALPAILLSRELYSGNSTSKHAILGLMGEFRRVLAGIVAHGQATREFRADIDAEQAASLLIAVVQGTAVRWLLGNRGFDLAAEGQQLIDLTLGGIAAAPSPAEGA